MFESSVYKSYQVFPYYFAAMTC